MSLQGLISGSDCAVPSNPLSQVLKHAEGDRSLQQDRVAGPSSARLQHLPSTTVAPGSQQDISLARQFFDGNALATSAGPSFGVPQHLPPPEVMRGMSRHATPDLNKVWANSQQQQFLSNPLSQQSTTSWTNEFGAVTPHAASTLPVQSAPQQTNSFQPSFMPSRTYNGMMPMGMYSNFSTMNGTPIQAYDKGKGKSRDIDFEAAFAQFDKSESQQQQNARIVEMDENSTAEELEVGMQRASLQDEEVEEDEIGFKDVWDNLQDSDLPPPQEDLAKWEAEYNQLMNAQRDDLDYDYGSVGSDLGYEQRETVQFDDQGMPVLGDYVFETENRYLDPSSSNRSKLADAKSLLENNGSLTEAALLLEAAIQQGELGKGDYETWILLGEVRSMDEREDQAMRALMEGVKRAERAGDTGEGMLSLAISFTNESYEKASHTMLLRWLSARYPHHLIPQEMWRSLDGAAWNSHERVTEAFLALARDQHSRGELDPDVQIGLGVLSYTNGDYDRAKDCFEAALTVRPNDYLLWNRFGSSLSNGDNPEAALGAYREALQLRPTYTRAIYNVGVACLNIGAYKEAAEHFLSALAMQDSSAGAKSDQLWFTLRRALLSLNRVDLAGKAKTGTPLEVFREEGFDF